MLAVESPAPPQAPFYGSNSSSSLVTQQPQPPVPGPSPLPQQLQQYSLNASSSSSIPNLSQQPQFPPGVKVPQNEQIGSSSLAPPQQTSTIGGQRSPSTSQQPAPPQTQTRIPPPAPTAFPGSLSDLVGSFESVKQKGTPLSCCVWLSVYLIVCASTISCHAYDQPRPGSQDA